MYLDHRYHLFLLLCRAIWSTDHRALRRVHHGLRRRRYWWYRIQRARLGDWSGSYRSLFSLGFRLLFISRSYW